MEEIIAGNVEQLCEKVKGKDVYIYGAKLCGYTSTWLCSIYLIDMIIPNSYMARRFIG